MEGKTISPTLVPDQLKNEEWWKKRQTTPTSQSQNKTVSQAKSPVATNQKQPAPSKQPAVTSQKKNTGPRAQPSTSKAPPRATGAQAVRKPVGRGATSTKPGGTGRPGQSTAKPAASSGGRGIATLGNLKSGSQKKPTVTSAVTTPPAPQVKQEESAKPAQAPTVPGGKAEVNKRTYHPRMGLARALAKKTDGTKYEEAHSLYREVMSMSPEVHDAYIELGEMLAKTNPVEAVDVYSKFPFNDPPTFDDAFLHGEIVRLLMSSENYDDSRLCTSMVAMGKALGIGVLEKQVSILENKFKSSLLKQIYAGVHGKPIDDPDLQAFFKFKCWL